MLTDLTVIDIYDTELEDNQQLPLFHHHKIYSTEQANSYGLTPFRVSISEIIEEINRDHSEQWIDYDEHDWIEGMYEWTSWRLMEENIYVLLAIIEDTPYGKMYGDYKRLTERYGGV